MNDQPSDTRPRISRSFIGLALTLLLVAVSIPLFFKSASNNAASEPQPIGLAGSWKLIFRDEFDGKTLDTKKWATCYWWDVEGCTNAGNKELEWYQPDNVTVENGVLKLRAKEQTISDTKGNSYPYTSGMVTTGTTDYKNSPANFSFKYGYVEVKARIPKGQGIWPAIWLLPDDWTSKPEIDIMEVLGHEPGNVHMTYHFKKNDKDDANEGDTWETTDLSQDWHTFGVLWQPEAITWYIDGVERWRYTDQKRISDKKMYLLINLAVGGEWPGSPDKTTVFPADYLIDYVRMWSATDASSK